MVINVAQLLKEPTGSQRRVEVCSDEDPNLRGVVHLLRTDRSILVSGDLTSTVETSCSRCLKEFTQPVTLAIEEEFFPTVDVVTGFPLPEPDDVDAFTIDEHHQLNLGEAVRQYALLALPIKPLCRADCRGLCPQCGRNLNQGPCSCPDRPRDPRWAQLERLAEAVDDRETVAG